jgi:predicted Zn-ribbon and HTH transcriptional regulator
MIDIQKKLNKIKKLYLRKSNAYSHHTIVKIENDATKNTVVKTLSHIAKAVGVSVDRLITGKPNEL